MILICIPSKYFIIIFRLSSYKFISTLQVISSIRYKRISLNALYSRVISYFLSVSSALNRLNKSIAYLFFTFWNHSATTFLLSLSNFFRLTSICEIHFYNLTPFEHFDMIRYVLLYSYSEHDLNIDRKLLSSTFPLSMGALSQISSTINTIRHYFIVLNRKCWPTFESTAFHNFFIESLHGTIVEAGTSTIFIPDNSYFITG
jgi:hypothetical protein